MGCRVFFCTPTGWKFTLRSFLPEFQIFPGCFAPLCICGTSLIARSYFSSHRASLWGDETASTAHNVALIDWLPEEASGTALRKRYILALCLIGSLECSKKEILGNFWKRLRFRSVPRFISHNFDTNKTCWEKKPVSQLSSSCCNRVLYLWPHWKKPGAHICAAIFKSSKTKSTFHQWPSNKITHTMFFLVGWKYPRVWWSFLGHLIRPIPLFAKPPHMF